jgi:hypothetical protein
VKNRIQGKLADLRSRHSCNCGVLQAITPTHNTGAAGWFFYRRHAWLAFLTERYRLARGTLQLPILGDRDRSKSAHAFLVGAVPKKADHIVARASSIVTSTGPTEPSSLARDFPRL